ncbi:rho GTPase-activating protein 19-like isoform X2 [Photinus pyralis]|nr:rho GTPase-activating protein 19-like isoform X2 [Photinus pyralis]
MFKRDCLAEKLRRENVEQFNTLVRMHLSFVLDLSTEEDALSEKSKLRKWSFIPFNKKSKICRGIMDGIPLTQEGICQVYQLIEFLKQEPNISTEGIFRRTGSLARQQELKNLLNQGVTVSLENNTYSVHDCASVLKGFLADLPEPLLTEAHYPAHCQIAELCGVCENSAMEAKLLHALQLLLLLLPSENRILLKDVLDLLHYTASYERNNKMSADSLATLFTPHLLCPRNLTPEILHTNSQILSNTVSFMITNSSKLFELPPKLAVDIKAYYTEQERRKLSSRNCNESLSDNFAANTVYSFVDVERTTKENQSNPTETALAQLYAYIQSLPESSKKQKLIKQFNKENGYGTPLQVIRSSVANKNKSVGSSIKKHIFQRSIAKVHKRNATPLRASSEELLNETMMTPRSRKPVLLVSRTNINNLPKITTNECSIDSIEELSDAYVTSNPMRRSKSVDQIKEDTEDGTSLSSSFCKYLEHRATRSPTDSSFTSCAEDYCSAEMSDNKLSSSLLHCLNGYSPPLIVESKELILQPKEFDDDEKPIIYETFF